MSHITFIIVITFCVMVYVSNRARHKMYAAFARDWHELKQKAIVGRDDVLAVDVTDVDQARIRDELIKLYDEDIARYTSYVEHYVNMVPHRRRKSLNCPID